MMRTTVSQWLMLAALLAITACNTMEGLGQDVQAGGRNLENAADRNKN